MKKIEHKEQLFFDFTMEPYPKDTVLHYLDKNIEVKTGNVIKNDGNRIIIKTETENIVSIVSSDVIASQKKENVLLAELNKPITFNDITKESFLPFGAWISETERLSEKQRNTANNDAVNLLKKEREQLTEADFETLKKYSGWGGIDAEERGVLYDFYTSPPIASFTWRLLNKVQTITQNSTILEPSCGTGIFFQCAPANVNLQGVELDERTGAIASIIHKNASIFIGSFEQFLLTNEKKYSNVIGNVPFGERSIKTAFMDLSDEKNLDRYFIQRSIDVTEYGGTIALIAHSGIIENESNKEWREKIQRTAMFKGAVRLSNTSFRHTHTSVSPDIYLFKKYPKDIINRIKDIPLQEFEKTEIYQSDWVNGTYFRTHPSNIMGKVLVGKGQWGSDLVVGNNSVQEIDIVLQNFTPETFSPTILNTIRTKYAETPQEQKETIKLTETEALAVSDKLLQIGDVKIEEKAVYILDEDFQWRMHKNDDIAVKLKLIKNISEDVQKIRESMHNGLSALELQVQTIQSIENYKKIYEVYPKEDKDIARFIRANPSVKGIYEGLINIDSEILTKSNVYDNEVVAFNGHNTAIEALEYLRQKMIPGTENTIKNYFPQQTKQIIKELYEHKDVFLSENSTFQLREDFIAGDAWGKIDTIRKKLEKEMLPDVYRKKFEYGIKELEAALGWVSIEEADITPQSAWIPEEIINKWVVDEYGLHMHPFVAGNIVLSKNKETDKWGVTYKTPQYIRGKSYNDGYTIGPNTWTEYAHEIVYFLNMQKQRSTYYDTPTYNKEKNDNFKNWLANNTEVREQLENLYNRIFNRELGVPTRTYPVMLSGWQENKTIKPHQWQTIHHLYQEQCGISALGTGFGKTLSGIGLLGLTRQEKKINRPFIQVPNNKVKDWVAEIQDVLPQLKIGFIDPESKDYSSKVKRYEKYHEIANTQYDVIIMPESAASEIQLRPENDMYITENVIYQYVAEKGGKTARRDAQIADRTERQLENGKTNLVINFEDFGCDAIFVDEAHRYKNLFTSSLSRDTGLNDGRQSAKAMALFKKCEYIRKNNNDKNIFLFTATPLTNSPLEYYNMMMFVAPKELQRFGISTIDGFIKNFAEIEVGMKYDWANSKMKEGKILVGFKNLRTLQDLFFKYTDLQNDPEKINLVKPKPHNKPNVLPVNKEQMSVLKTISEEFERFKSSSAEEKEAHFAGQNPLTFYSKLRTASLDLELYEPTLYKQWKNPKCDKLAVNAKEIFNATKAGQVIFCDRVFSSDSSFNMHEKIKNELIKKGFSPDDIVIVNGFTKSGGIQSDTNVEKEVSQAVRKYNEGKYKIIIGTTACIGEGLNLQNNSSALHHFDIPYRPSDFIQRNGRIDRQGNAQQTVELHTYLGSGTIDNYSVNLVQGKANWIDKLLNTKSNVFINQNDDTFFDADELMLALTEEWGDKEKAQERKEELEKQRAEKETDFYNEKRKNTLYNLSLMRGAIQSFSGDKGTIQYQNRIQKLHILDAALRNNPTFHNYEILDKEVPFLYNKKTDNIICTGDMLMYYNSIYCVTAIDIKKQKIIIERKPYEDEKLPEYQQKNCTKEIHLNDFNSKHSSIQAYFSYNDAEIYESVKHIGNESFNTLSAYIKSKLYLYHSLETRFTNIKVPVIEFSNGKYCLHRDFSSCYVSKDSVVNIYDTKIQEDILESKNLVEVKESYKVTAFDVVNQLKQFDKNLYDRFEQKIQIPQKEPKQEQTISR